MSGTVTLLPGFSKRRLGNMPHLSRCSHYEASAIASWEQLLLGVNGKVPGVSGGAESD